MFNTYPLLPLETIILFLILFLIILMSYFYFSVKQFIIRIIIFLSLFFLLINPMINSSEKLQYNDLLILVYDKTQSIVDTNKVLQLLEVKDSIKKNIKDINKLDLIEIEVNNLDDYKNNKTTKTEVFSKIQNKLQKINKDRISGVIVLTDGLIHDLEKISSDFFNIPIHFLLLGKKNERDRSIITENIPEYALVGEKISFLIKIKDDNYNEKVNTSFLIDGVQVYNKQLEPNISHEIVLPIKHAGVNLLEIEISTHKDELTTVNNYKAYEINGIHEKLRVMLISGEPNMGLRNWRNILNSDPSIELLHFTILRPPSKRDLTPVKELALIPFPTQELFSADMSKFSLIILDQYTLQGILPKKYLDNIVNYVLEGGAILSISGQEYLSDRSLINSPLSNILPTRPTEFVDTAFTPLLTELGKKHPITNSLKKSPSDKPWGKWFSYVKTEKNAGKILIEANKSPLLVISEVSKGRIAQILSDQSWVWKKDLDNKGPIIKLLRNTIHWLLKTPELQENFLKIKKENDVVTLNFSSLSENRNIGVITLPSKKSIPISLKDNQNGIFTGKFKSNETGKHSIKLGNLKKDFYIGALNNIELEEVKSSESFINIFFNENNKYLHSKTWIDDYIPQVVRVYNEKNISGTNWIGLLEKKVEKSQITSKKELISWLIFMPILLYLLFICWYREAR